MGILVGLDVARTAGNHADRRRNIKEAGNVACYGGKEMNAQLFQWKIEGGVEEPREGELVLIYHEGLACVSSKAQAFRCAWYQEGKFTTVAGTIVTPEYWAEIPHPDGAL